MFRHLLLLVFAGALGTNLLAQIKPYGGFDAQRTLIPGDKSTGKEPAVDVSYLDSWIDELAIHAKNYPVKFETDAEKAQAIRDITFLIGLMDTIIEPSKPNPELLRRAGFINSIAHNLDVKGAAQRSTDYFTRLLNVTPDDPVGNQMYGAFLGGAGHPKEAIPYLLKADSFGIRSATFSLGMSYLMLGEKAKALEYFEKYRKAVPEDKSVDQLIEAIKSGRVEFKKT